MTLVKGTRAAIDAVRGKQSMTEFRGRRLRGKSLDGWPRGRRARLRGGAMAKSRTAKRLCNYCGGEFDARPDQKYCSTLCRDGMAYEHVKKREAGRRKGGKT